MKSTTFGGTLLVLAAALLILGIAFAQEAGGTGGGAGGATQNATASDQEQQEKRYHFVVVENGMFSPDNLFIFAGDCVVWSDLQGHNVIQVNSTNSSVPLEGGFNSDLAKSNQTTGSGVVLNETVPVEYFSKCFDAVGEYFYISNRNASFLIGGAIIVMELPTACDANQTVTFSGTSLGLNLTAPVGILKVVDNIAGGDLASSPSSASWLVLGLKNGEIQYIDISQIGAANATPSTLLKLGNVLYEPEADGTSIPVRGLLGMAFDPNFNSTGRFFVHYTAPYQSEASGNATANATAPNKAINCLAMNGTEYCNLQTFDHVQRIEEYKWANGTSTLVRSLLVLKYPFFDHVGKNTLAFAEEGHLLVTIGDGGCARNDPLELAQNDLSFFGKIWRIDIVHLDLLISNLSLAECSFPPNGVFNITELNDICANYSQIFLLDSLGIRSPAGLAVIPGLSNAIFLDQLEDGTEINIANGMMQNFGWPLVSGYQCRIAQPGFSEGMCLATIPIDNITAAGNSTALPANANATDVGGKGNNTSGSGMHGEFYIKVPASVVADTFVAAGAWFGFNVECPLRGSFLFSRFGKLSYLPLYSPYSYLGEIVSLSEICSLANDNSTSNATEPASGASANATTVSTGGNASNTTGTSSEEIPSGLDEMDNMGEQVQDLTVDFADAAQFDAITALTSSQITNDIFVAGKLSAGSFAVYRIQRAAQGAA